MTRTDYASGTRAGETDSILFYINKAERKSKISSRPIMASGEDGGGSTKSSLLVGLEKEDEVERVFRRFDANGDGKISASELGEVVRALGSEVSPEEVEMMMAEMDSDRDGFVDLKEFAEFHRSGRGCAGGASSGGVDELRDAFDMYDLDKNGLISARELHMVLKRLGEKCSLHDCSRMISSVDGDGDGCVSFEEFKRMMTNKGGVALASPSTH